MKELLIDLVKEHALEEGECTLRSGVKTNYYLDCRKLTLRPWGLRAIINMLWEKSVRLKFDCIGGPCIGADPIVGGFVYRASMGVGRLSKTNGFLIRKSGKDHGKSGKVAGNLIKGQRCILVDDVTTTGGSMLEAVDVVQDLGCEVIKVFSVVDRLHGAAEEFLKRDIPFEPLLTIKDLGL